MARYGKIAGAALLAILVLFVVFHRPVLTSAGRFLAPTGAESAEVIVLEGTETVRVPILDAGIKLLSEGRARHMLVALHGPSAGRHDFVAQEAYPALVDKELRGRGLGRERVRVVPFPIQGHPVTLAEAKMVCAILHKTGVRRVILVTEGFHGRRSATVYAQEGAAFGLHVIPYPVFSGYSSDSWWHNAQGATDFFSELSKLLYYLLHGYVSIGSLWST